MAGYGWLVGFIFGVALHSRSSTRSTCDKSDLFCPDDVGKVCVSNSCFFHLFPNTLRNCQHSFLTFFIPGVSRLFPAQKAPGGWGLMELTKRKVWASTVATASVDTCNMNSFHLMGSAMLVLCFTVEFGDQQFHCRQDLNIWDESTGDLRLIMDIVESTPLRSWLSKRSKQGEWKTTLGPRIPGTLSES